MVLHGQAMQKNSFTLILMLMQSGFTIMIKLLARYVSSTNYIKSFLNKQFSLIANKKTVFDFCNNYDVLDKCEIPDGMTVDMNGHIYVAVFHGRKVLKIDSLTG